MKSILKGIQYDLLDYIDGDEDAEYSSEDVTACITLLLEFMSKVEEKVRDLDTAEIEVRELVLSLNELNEQCEHALIETSQREDIVLFIEKVIRAANIDFSHDITECWREW